MNSIDQDTEKDFIRQEFFPDSQYGIGRKESELAREFITRNKGTLDEQDTKTKVRNGNEA